MKRFGKQGLITGIIADIIPIIVSAFANNNISNKTLRNIVYFCYSIRIELVCILVLLLTVLVFIPLLKKLWSNDTYFVNRAIAISCVIIGLTISFHSIKVFLVSRRDYYKNGYFLAQTQYLPFREANRLFENGHYEKAKERYAQVIDLNQNGYYTFPAIRKNREIEKIIRFRDDLFDFLKIPEKGTLSLDQMEGLSFLNNVFPDRYDYLYDRERRLVDEAIDMYPQFYRAVQENSFEKCQQLIRQYGWCWFERTVFDKFSDGNKVYLQRLWFEYIHGESLEAGLVRLKNKWATEYENNNL